MKDYKLIKFTDNEFELDINISLEERTAWLSLDDLAKLFSRDRSSIGKHVRNIIKNQTNNSVWAKIARTVAKNATVAHARRDSLINKMVCKI